MAVSMMNILKTFGKSITSLQSKKISKTQYEKILRSSYTLLDKSGMPGSGKWTASSASCSLMGNVIRPYWHGETTTATGAGDITDQKICTFTINDPRITYIPSLWGFCSGGTGGPHRLLFKRTTDSNPWKCEIYLVYTHAAASSTSFETAIPVILDVTKY